MKIYLLKRKAKLSKESIEIGKVKKTSLYLMYHFASDVKREYEWLNLYLYEKPKNQIEKDHNKQTLQLAETIKSKRILDAQSTSHGFISTVKSKICFLAFFRKLVDKKYESEGNHGNWLSTYNHLVNFTNGKELPIERVDERFLEAFKDYFVQCKSRKGNTEKKLNKNSAVSYFNKVRAALKEAYQQRLIKENPTTRVKGIKGQSTHREFLTFEELEKLAVTPCDLPVMKLAFLTSTMSGLRYSDLKALKWENIKHSEQDGYHIQYTQKKTKKAEVLPIANHVVEMLGERGENDEPVFKGLQYSAWNNLKIREWVMKAGINKKITMHCGRHTYACLHLSMGTDLSTIRDLLGHSNIKTTQIYAKVIDKTKIAAASKIPQINYSAAS
jgi:integrase